MAQAVYPVAAVFGDRAADITSAGLSPGSTGVFEVTVRVPAVDAGAYRLVVKVNGVPSNAAIIEVSGSRPGPGAALKRE
jgi:uncharacterized protein (TIGR03437 family)